MDTIDLSGDSDYQQIKTSIKQVRFVPLETTDSSTIAGVDKAVLFENNIFILDRQYAGLKVFSSAGKYIRTIGRLGQGAGQYSELQDFIILPERRVVMLLCNDREALLAFDPEGHYLGKRDLHFFASNFDVVGDAFYFYVNQNASEVSGNYNLLETDTAGTLLGIRARASPFPKSFKASILFSGFLGTSPNGVLYSPAFGDTIFQINQLGVSPRYAFSFGRFALPPNARKSFNDFVNTPRKYSYVGSAVVESENLLSFSYVCGSKMVLGLYNKTNGHLKKLAYKKDDALSGILHPPVSLIGKDNLVSYIATNNLFNQIKGGQISKPDLDKDYPELSQLASRLHPTDNPILVLYTLNEF